MPVGLISILNQSSHSGQLVENRKKHSEATSSAKTLSIKVHVIIYADRGHTSAIGEIRSKFKKGTLLFSQEGEHVHVNASFEHVCEKESVCYCPSLLPEAFHICKCFSLLSRRVYCHVNTASAIT